ncbi:hypothetical protein VII00023_20267 [Vibrio ichthyoenteri ATCC 700023]|uniref:Uncharacterized protein n=1 Tax=Vibrio ichthyoenteri ATCC 700023 TaxID=870968 RepID=F9RXN6_9VIBR|nr:YeeE/YedE thiosulfate transporter family protein [Vibrio ichthyoenteri]EGU47765.1 hypothetical protein VII00023_20267 [Vibrio ichthyoenteri ATCC 700023]
MWQVIPWQSLLGGMLLGLSAVLLLLVNGKIAGISGIINGVVNPDVRDRVWRVLFLAGMAVGGVSAVQWLGASVPTLENSNLWIYIVAGLLVGIGTSLGNGCTSGHGICGIGRLSKRSIVATVVFMSIAILTVFVRVHLL